MKHTMVAFSRITERTVHGDVFKKKDGWISNMIPVRSSPGGKSQNQVARCPALLQKVQQPLGSKQHGPLAHLAGPGMKKIQGPNRQSTNSDITSYIRFVKGYMRAKHAIQKCDQTRTCPFYTKPFTYNSSQSSNLIEDSSLAG